MCNMIDGLVALKESAVHATDLTDFNLWLTDI